MREIKNKTEFKLKVNAGDWLLVIRKKDINVRWLYKILKFKEDDIILVDRYCIFGENGNKEFKKYQNQMSYILPRCNSDGWEFNKLNKEEIKKWRKIVIVSSL